MTTRLLVGMLTPAIRAKLASPISPAVCKRPKFQCFADVPRRRNQWPRAPLYGRPEPQIRENPELVPVNSDFSGFRQLLFRDSSCLRRRTEEILDPGSDVVDRPDTIDGLQHAFPIVIVGH